MADNKEATNYVLLAVGGTGAKVAEAMVNMMSLGIPMATDASGKGFSSLNANDSVTVVRIDPDKACRAESLQAAIKRYRQMQEVGGSGETRGLWTLRLNDLVSIHPMDALSGPSNVETLTAKLASNVGKELAGKILRLFYTAADVDTSLDRGFFQKPYLGAAVIASMAETKLESKTELIQRLEGYRNKRLRAFVVGSMYGGTGAAGIPVLARIVKSLKGEEDDWLAGGCLLGPYFYPPRPPIQQIDWGPEWSPESKEEFDEYLERSGKKEREYLEQVQIRNEGRKLAGFGRDYSWPELRQIARGYYAKPDEIDRRAYASWEYYHRHGSKLFDSLYLLGLRNPTRYGDVTLRAEDYPDETAFDERIPWSNGGRNQISPLHAVEYAAAGLAFHFFTLPGTPAEGTSLLGVHQHDSSTGDALCWSDVPASPEVSAARWLSTALAGVNFVKFGLLPNISTRQAFENTRKSFPALHSLVSEEHYEDFHDDLQVLADTVHTTLLHTLRALGWEENDTLPLMRKWHGHEMTFGRARSGFSSRPRVYSLARWDLHDVDLKRLGKEVPSRQEVKELRGYADEARGSLPLGVTYLQALWNYLAAHMEAAREVS